MSNFKKIDKATLPAIPIRNVVVFPGVTTSFDIGRLKSILAIEKSVSAGSLIFLVSQKDSSIVTPDKDDIYEVGVVGKITQIIKIKDDMIRIVAEGLKRAKFLSFTKEEPYFELDLQYLEDESYSESEALPMVKTAHEAFEEFSIITGKFPSDVIRKILEIDEAGSLADALMEHVSGGINEKQEILTKTNPIERLESAIKSVYKDIEIAKLQQQVLKRVKVNLDKHQKDFYLREQIKVAQDELGENEVSKNETNEYKERIGQKIIPDYVKEKLTKELKRLEKINSYSPEAATTRDYIDNILDLEWDSKTEETKDLAAAEEILNNSHYGLEKVKERIIEFLAVRQVTQNLNSPILCLVGPPGVGKTSIAKSIAKSLNRKYVRISLGGVRDEAEIRGHRRTYLGSIPGRIIYAMKQAKTCNPLILLDEIDKMSSDVRGNPAAAMLEVLDSEQNKTFRDSYIELNYDLSNVLFFCTANAVDSIPDALKDRLEIITLSSYTKDEKIKIASNFLVEKQLKMNGFSDGKISIKSDVLGEIIEGYTKEAGVRSLERNIAKIFRKVLKDQITNKADLKNCDIIEITKEKVEKYLGMRKYRKDKISEEDESGVVKGLAWTNLGGEILSVEANIVSGEGKIELTGNMGDVMKESAKAGLSYIRANSERLNIEEKFYKQNDIHIHIPAGAVPKDGPSGGITMATAIISALTGSKVKKDVAMTGEITIRGRVLAIGGLKEKVIAGKSAGVKTIIIPKENENDLIELDEKIREGLKFVLVKDIQEVIDEAFVNRTKGHDSNYGSE